MKSRVHSDNKRIDRKDQFDRELKISGNNANQFYFF